MKQKLLFLTITILTLFSLTVGRANADMYGEEEPTKQLVIDKEVKPVDWEGWSDHLSASKVSFTAEDKVDFRIIVKNSGDEELKNINVIDYLPDYVNFVTCSDNCSQDNKEIKWHFDKLNAGEEKHLTLQAQVVKSEDLEDKGLFCITNWSKATADGGLVDENGSQFCIDTRILGAEVLPEAGINLLWPITALSALIIGLFKKIKK